MVISCYDYKSIFQHPELLSLRDRKILKYLLCLFKLLKDLMDCSAILKLISFNIPSKTLKRNLLHFLM